MSRAPEREYSVGRGKILVVDDEKTNRDILNALLKADGYDVEEAESGAEAIRVIQGDTNHKIDLVLMDVQMLKMNGYEACLALRNIGFTKPIIFQTSQTDDSAIDQCFESGGNEYIRKPIHPQLLRARVEAQIAFFRQSVRLGAQARQIDEQAKKIDEMNRLILKMKGLVLHRLGNLLNSVLVIIDTMSTNSERYLQTVEKVEKNFPLLRAKWTEASSKTRDLSEPSEQNNILSVFTEQTKILLNLAELAESFGKNITDSSREHVRLSGIIKRMQSALEVLTKLVPDIPLHREAVDAFSVLKEVVESPEMQTSGVRLLWGGNLIPQDISAEKVFLADVLHMVFENFVQLLSQPNNAKILNVAFSQDEQMVLIQASVDGQDFPDDFFREGVAGCMALFNDEECMYREHNYSLHGAANLLKLAVEGACMRAEKDHGIFRITIKLPRFLSEKIA